MTSSHHLFPLFDLLLGIYDVLVDFGSLPASICLFDKFLLFGLVQNLLLLIWHFRVAFTQDFWERRNFLILITCTDLYVSHWHFSVILESRALFLIFILGILSISWSHGLLLEDFIWGILRLYSFLVRLFQRVFSLKVKSLTCLSLDCFYGIDDWMVKLTWIIWLTTTNLCSLEISSTLRCDLGSVEHIVIPRHVKISGWIPWNWWPLSYWLIKSCWVLSTLDYVCCLL